MARKQSGKPPHKVGDGGWQREFPAAETIWIGPEISVTICRSSGRIAVGIKAPREYEIVVGDGTDLQKPTNS